MTRYNRWLLHWWPLFLVPLTVSLVVAIWGAVAMLRQEPPRAAQAQVASAEPPKEDPRDLLRLALIEHSLNKKGLGFPGIGLAAGLIAKDAKPSDTTPAADSQKALEESRAEAAEAYSDVEHAIAEQAKRAHVVIELERAMQVGRDYTASLIIEGGLGKDVPALAQATTEPIVTELDVEIAPDAEAYASSSQFTVLPITPAKQAIRSQAPTVWQWTLTPRRDGEASLMIILRQNVRIGNSVFTFPVRQFPQVITVELTWWLWLRDLVTSFWGFVTAILVTGASAATIFSAWKNREKETAEPSSETSRDAKAEKPSSTRRRPA